MTTLPAFLLARLAEDEDAAEHVNRGLWNSRVAMLDPDLYGHIARHHPARVLADVAAKRAIVEWAAPILTDWPDAPEGFRYVSDDGRDLLLILASVYASHPEFDERWAL